MISSGTEAICLSYEIHCVQYYEITGVEVKETIKAKANKIQVNL